MSHVNSATQIGRILAARRKSMGLSQGELAIKLGLSQNRLSELESQPGKLTLERLLSLLNLLGLELQIDERAASFKARSAQW
jgi:HTH-type transcriptional regulator/antitoxin HipB